MSTITAPLSNIIILLIVVCVPVLIATGILLTIVARRRLYARIIPLDEGLTFYRDRAGNILIRSRGPYNQRTYWFSVAGAIGFALLIVLGSANDGPGRAVSKGVFAGGVALLIFIANYWSYRSINFDVSQRLIETRNKGKRSRISFDSILAVSAKEIAPRSSDRATRPISRGLTGLALPGYQIQLVLKDNNVITLCHVASWLGAKHKSKAQVEEIVSAIQSALATEANPEGEPRATAQKTALR